MPTLYTILRAQHRHARPAAQYIRKSKHGRTGHRSLAAQRKDFLAGLTPDQRASFKSKPNKSVIVVGAGLSGLCAAYELDLLRYDVAVYEARDRVGGRVYSISNFIPKRTIEGGGELIGRNHPLWCGYAKAFKLKFSDVEEYGNSSVRFNGRTLTYEQSATLADEMDKYFERLNRLAESILDPYEPWTNPNAERLDKTSLSQWLKTLKYPDEDSDDDGTKKRLSADARDAVEQQLTADNGIPASQQSLLGVLAMIKGHGVDRYWSDTELYRCDGGNDRLAKEFKRVLKGAVHLQTMVTTIEKKGGKVSVSLARVAVDEEEKKPPKILEVLPPVQADDVILAIPPSVWNHITFKNEDLATQLREGPHIGSNVKNIFALKSRFWQDYSSSPTLSDSNGPADMTWETTEAIKGDRPEFALVAFSGSTHAELLSKLSDAARNSAYDKQLEIVYPRLTEQRTDTKFINWPEKYFTRGSYYFPRTKEVTRWGPFWKNGYGDWLHFAGEHTSYAFMGYMEGALSSGFRLAHRLAVRDKLLP